MGPGAKLPIGPCGGWGFWLYLVSESVTDTDICGFIGLTPYFECPLNQTRNSHITDCETVSVSKLKMFYCVKHIRAYEKKNHTHIYWGIHIQILSSAQ